MINTILKIIVWVYIILNFTLQISNCLAQQIGHFTQYQLNDYLVNPAVAGSRDYFEVRTNGRSQWVGFPGAPQTIILSGFGPYHSENVALGGVFYNDNTGPSSTTGLNGSYTFHVRVNESARLGMGLSLGMMQYRLDGTKLELADKGEPGVPTGIESSIVPDGNFGFYWYTSTYYISLSSYHVFHNRMKKDLFVPTSNNFGYLVSHYNIFAGYKYAVNDQYEIEPSFQLQGVQPVPVQFDFSVKATYENKYWLGVNFRTHDAFSILAGLNYKDHFVMGYSFDLTLTGLKKFNSGSHEVMAGYRFDPPKRKKYERDSKPEIE